MSWSYILRKKGTKVVCSVTVIVDTSFVINLKIRIIDTVPYCVLTEGKKLASV